jgi:PhzF family phenazine biosynthesis protein
MTRSVKIHQVDAFTRARFTGKPAGVVLGADALDDAEMLAIARELNNADTAFVLRPDAPDHDLRVRFFTPRTEAAFVGHATVAAHYVLSQNPDAPTRLRQKTRAGIADIHIQGEGDGRRIAIRQAAAPLGRMLDEQERAQVLDALALDAAHLDARCPLRIAGAGSTRLLIGVRAAEHLTQLKPDLTRLAALSAQLGAAGYFLFTLEPKQPDCHTEARMFCPALGIPEDPVSGNAHGMLGVYLTGLGLLPPDARGHTRFTGAQGHHMHRPGRVGIEVEKDSAAVWISGQAASVFETMLTL